MATRSRSSKAPTAAPVSHVVPAPEASAPVVNVQEAIVRLAATAALGVTDQITFNAAARDAGGAGYSAEFQASQVFLAGHRAGLSIKEAMEHYKIGAVCSYALACAVKGKPRIDRKGNEVTTPQQALAYALAVRDLSKPPQNGTPANDTHRTPEEHSAWSGAGNKLTALLRKIGLREGPKTDDEAKAKRKAAQAEKDAVAKRMSGIVEEDAENDDASSVPINLNIAAPPLPNTQAAMAFVRDTQAMMLRTLNSNAKSVALQGDGGSLIREMVAAWVAGAKKLAEIDGFRISETE